MKNVLVPSVLSEEHELWEQREAERDAENLYEKVPQREFNYVVRRLM